MIISNIKWRNLLSYGNYWTEVDLTKNILTVVVGKNGSGKTTFLLDTICFAFFGRLFRDVKKKQYVNSVTKKELEVNLTFLIGNDEYLVVRGQKPDKFEIYKNSTLIPQDSTTSAYQDKLENIIGMNFRTFCQVIILGDKYVPFLSLPAADRRKIVENILDLEVFSVMNIKAKAHLSDLVLDIKSKEGERILLQSRINNVIENIEKNSEDKQKIIDLFEEKVNKIDVEIDQIEQKEMASEARLLPCDDYKKYCEIIIKFQEKIKIINDRIMQVSFKRREINQEIDFWSKMQNVCPKCTQTVSKEFVLNKIEVLKETLNKCDESDEILKERRSKIETELKDISKLTDEHDGLLDQLSLLDGDKLRFQADKKSLTKQIQSFIETKVGSDQSALLSNLQTELVALKDRLDDSYKKRSVLDELIVYLKDDGFKAEIIRGYIDVINELMNKFLMDMDFFCEFYFDQEFNETIKSRYRDEFTYQSFSAGEKLRIDLAILASWRELAKRRNSVSANLLIFDEILSSALDVSGVNDLIDILKKAKMADNCFIITHTESCSGLVENNIEVHKVKGFSHINLEKY